MFKKNKKQVNKQEIGLSALTFMRDWLTLPARSNALFRFASKGGWVWLATAELTSSTIADISRSILIFTVQAGLAIELWIYFKKPLNWTFNCQVAVSSEVLAEETPNLYLRGPLLCHVFFTSVQKKCNEYAVFER